MLKVLIEAGFLSEIHEKLRQEQQRLTWLLKLNDARLCHQKPGSMKLTEQTIEVGDANKNDTKVVTGLDQGAQIKLSQINKALRRIERGKYGECVVCGQSIHQARLRAIPHTPFCHYCVSAK